VRETERRARGGEGGQDKTSRHGSPRPGAVLHPDLEEALAAAEDALSAVLGREVRVRARGGGFRAEFALDTPAEGVRLAERLLGEGAPSPPVQSPRRAISSVG
jgi:ParB family transcriptional regulator, chromosome partitioning protein